jgi:hypothetical protein
LHLFQKIYRPVIFFLLFLKWNVYDRGRMIDEHVIFGIIEQIDGYRIQHFEIVTTLSKHTIVVSQIFVNICLSISFF